MRLRFTTIAVLCLSACGSEGPATWEYRRYTGPDAEIIEAQVIRSGCVKDLSGWVRYFESDPRRQLVGFYFDKGHADQQKAGRYSGPLPLDMDGNHPAIAGFLNLKNGEVDLVVCSPR